MAKTSFNESDPLGYGDNTRTCDCGLWWLLAAAVSSVLWVLILLGAAEVVRWAL